MKHFELHAFITYSKQIIILQCMWTAVEYACDFCPVHFVNEMCTLCQTRWCQTYLWCHLQIACILPSSCSICLDMFKGIQECAYIIWPHPGWKMFFWHFEKVINTCQYFLSLRHWQSYVFQLRGSITRHAESRHPLPLHSSCPGWQLVLLVSENPEQIYEYCPKLEKWNSACMFVHATLCRYLLDQFSLSGYNGPMNPKNVLSK